MQMIKGCYHNDPALRKTTALRMRWEQCEKPCLAAVENAGKGISGNAACFVVW